MNYFIKYKYLKIEKRIISKLGDLINGIRKVVKM